MRNPAIHRLKPSHLVATDRRPLGRWLATTALEWLMVMGASDAALAQVTLPQGGSVVSGQARIAAPSGNGLSVVQNSSRAIIDWNSFSVGAGGSVNFVQPTTSSAILNRVTGSTSSSIAGQVSGNGQVFLVNPNGIAITPTGSVQVGGGFVASTLDIANADFNAGQLKFLGSGASAAVSNAGVISSAPGGFVGLIGGSAANAGTINVPLGKVALGSGEQATLDPTGDGFLQVAVPTDAVAANGRALVDVAGRIRAAGGTVEIKAATAQQAVRDAVNMSGSISARSAFGRSGNIVLDGGAGGNVTVSGKLAATGGKLAHGGSVTIAGRTIGLKGAVVDVSGGSGGGTVEIGGGPRGSGALPHAVTTSVDGTSLIRADATTNGNGGNVTIWSDDATTFAGHISARGGSQGGNGGQAEVSGKAELDLTGDYGKTPLADLSALRGTTGTILFDPGTVEILDQNSLTNRSALNGPDTFTAQFISGQLSSANVTIDTNNATGANGAAGDINLGPNAQISWSSNNSLTLNAARNINFASSASISGTGATAGLLLRADSGGTGIGTVNFAGGNQVSLPSGTVNIQYDPASNPAGSAVNGTSYTGATPASENWSSFVSAGTLRAWMLVNSASDLQNIQNNLAGTYLLGTNIDASATSGWNGGAGFVPIGTNGAGVVTNGGNGFVGTLDGGGHVVDGLAINRGSVGYVGLFGNLGTGATVQNIGLTNVAITGGVQFDGALVGFASSGTSITNASSSGSVTGANWVGGLVARSVGTIAASHSSSAVTGLTRVGGLAGETNGTISQSWATGIVTGAASSNRVAGLVGYSNGSVSQSYATGAVSAGAGSTNVGGLIGEQGGGNTTQSYATGSVSANGQGIGGLVGKTDSGGSVDQSYATGAVSGNSYAGGLVGWNQGSVIQSYATGAVAGNGGSLDIGGLVGFNDTSGSIATTWSSGAVSGSSNVGGLVGLNSNSITGSYFDSTTSGQAGGVGSGTSTGVTALTTSQAFTQSSYAGWDFAGTWYMVDGQTRPFLQSEYSTTIVNAHQLQLVNLSNATLGATYTLGANVDASSTTGAGSSMWGSSGFVPLGTDGAGGLLNAGNGFAGSFNGAGNTVQNLFISRAGKNYIGLIGDAGTGASISNLGVVSANVTGSRNTGIVVGLNSGNITGSFSTGTVSGDQNQVGGLVGGQFNGTIDKSFSSASVSGSTFAGMGGLLGFNNAGTVSRSYATGSVTSTGTGGAGGLVGNNNSLASIQQSYATGAVSATSGIAGGLVGSNSGTLGTSYFDKQTTGQTNGVGAGTAGGTGLTTATFQDGSLPAGFDPTVWTAQSGQYPRLGPSPPQVVKVIATDSGAGSLTYGNAPSFSTSVTDLSGNVLCTSSCSTYFSGAPLIDTTLTSTDGVGTSAPGYIAKGTLAAASGYVVQFVNDLLSVTPRPLTVTASDQSKTYGATALLGHSAFTTSGLVNGDTVSSVNLASTGSGPGANVAGGPYAIVGSAAAGSGLANYGISYVNGHLTVSPAPVNVTALGGSSSFGSSPANPGLSATGLQNGQGVDVLTGLSNSFGISSASTAGSYTTNVAGTLTNPNYTVVGANSGTWTVTPLRGSLTDIASSWIPGLSVKPPANQSGVDVLNALQNASTAVNARSSAGAPRPARAATPARNVGSPLPAPSPPAVAPTTTPVPSSPVAPIASPPIEPSSNAAAASARSEAPGCDGDSAASGQNPDCNAAKKPAGLIDFALKNLNRNALFGALDRELAELSNATNATPTILMKSAAVTSVGLTIGIIGWFLRSGALLSTLLSIVPLWREFDPLLVVRYPRRRDPNERPTTRVDRMFDDAQSSQNDRRGRPS